VVPAIKEQKCHSVTLPLDERWCPSKHMRLDPVLPPLRCPMAWITVLCRTRMIVPEWYLRIPRADCFGYEQQLLAIPAIIRRLNAPGRSHLGGALRIKAQHEKTHSIGQE
jgi:hypothetical protein